MTAVTQTPESRRPSPRWLIALAIAVAALLISGCGGDDETTTAASAPTTEATTEATTTEDDGDAGEDEGSGQKQDSGQEEPQTVKQKDAPPVETIGAPKPPKGGDDSIHTFGKEASEQDLRGAAAALNGYLQARVKKDWALSCAYMSSGMVDQLMQLMQQNPETENMDCAEIVEAMSGHLDKKSRKRMANIQIGTARVEDDRAFVLYKEAGVGWMMMPMNREDGEWKVSAIAGSVLP